MANAPCPSVAGWPSAAQHCVYEWLLAPHPYCLWLPASRCNCTEQMLAVQAGLLMMPPSACWQTLPEPRGLKLAPSAGCKEPLYGCHLMR